MSTKTQYVIGFMFLDNATSVVMVRKNKPAWQAGLLNGVGGKIEDGETPLMAMIREFKEETGVDSTKSDWRAFAVMVGQTWTCDCFVAFDSDAWEKAATVEAEDIQKYNPDHVEIAGCISNVPWLLKLALDGNNGKPPFATIDYLSLGDTYKTK